MKTTPDMIRAIPDRVIDEAIEAIITARDFCGDEREAVKEVANDNGFFHVWKALHKIANFHANAQWNAWKKAAGVNPKHCW
jgi:hypothetical protein